MKYLIVVIISFFLSCRESKNDAPAGETNIADSILTARHYSAEKQYPYLSLLYKSKPFQIIGRSIDSLIKMDLSFRSDPNLEFQDLPFGIITDYLSADDNFWILTGENKSINGIIYFSCPYETKEVFSLSGSWTFNTEINEITKPLVIDKITTTLFPVLKDHLQIENGWKFEVIKENLIEKFEIDSGRFYWHLRYNVILI